MERRAFLVALPAIAAVLRARTSEASDAGEAGELQDLEFIRAWERAQQQRPRVLTSQARIAPAGEPGIPLHVAGRLFDRDGRSPAPGITVFAYHTDAQGNYDVRSNGAHSWRLKAWVQTDTAGRFQFDTVRPAPYPGRNVAAHVHVYLYSAKLQRRSMGILFDGDPLISREERAESDRAREFGSILKAITRGGEEYVDYKIKITNDGIF